MFASVFAAQPFIGVGSRAIEADEFPFETVSEIAERESWRKEIGRPIYHIHKWWAQRLGSVFRAILLGASGEAGRDIVADFYSHARLSGVVIFDPFMGSGTTIGEALKLGARAVGRDINPVAYFIVKAALGRHPRDAVEAEFEAIERDVAGQLQRWYQTTGPDGVPALTLYYFWVKVVRCPGCAADVDLFSNYLFVKNAYVRRQPLCRVVCPECGDVSAVGYGVEDHTCPGCLQSFNPMAGPAHGASATCRHCNCDFSILRAVRAEGGGPPRHRMYAKMVLTADGAKSYMRTTAEDVSLYEAAEHALGSMSDPYPVVALSDGYNTKQAINYGYRHWHDFFNSRQLLCLSILAKRIEQIDDDALRDLFTALFSGVLEFNNMFASFKGEGTGAVRHMFSHHILKPERVPLEANIWGTPKSSGSFSTLFRSRVLRAIDYKRSPFELGLNGRGSKVHGLADPLGANAAGSYGEFDSELRPLYLSCGDSSATDLPDESVDLVVTDPPFFDNVHYSELADFFHVWQRHILGARDGISRNTTRSIDEVQSTDPGHFASRLGAVWQECRRVLRDSGLLIFTYHHSRSEGWRSVLEALLYAGFVITAAQPVKSEMSVATPKSQAKEPIDLDIVFVCRKQPPDLVPSPHDPWLSATEVADAQVRRFWSAGRSLSRNDLKIVLMAQLLRAVSTRGEEGLVTMASMERDVQYWVERLRASAPAIGPRRSSA